MDICLLELFEIRGIFKTQRDFEMKMFMRNFGKPTVFGGLLHSASSLAVPPLEQQQAIAEDAHKSQLAAFAATTGAGKIGYGILTFWIVVAVLVAARVAFLDPSKIKSNSSLPGAKATSAWNAGESPSVERFVRR